MFGTRQNPDESCELWQSAFLAEGGASASNSFNLSRKLGFVLRARALPSDFEEGCIFVFVLDAFRAPPRDLSLRRSKSFGAVSGLIISLAEVASSFDVRSKTKLLARAEESLAGAQP